MKGRDTCQEVREAGLVYNRLHHGIFEIAVELPVGIVGLDHQDADHFSLGSTQKCVPKAPSHPKLPAETR